MLPSFLRREHYKGLEVALILLLIVIIIGIVVLAINPAKQLGDARNTQRRSDLLRLLDGVYGYAIANSGNVPAGIPLQKNSCTQDAAQLCLGTTLTNCDVQLTNVLVPTYLPSLPQDPQATGNGSGYHIVKDSAGVVSVCAPAAENGLQLIYSR